MSRLPITEVLDPAPADGPDWAAIERDYRTGQFTLRELAAKHGSSPATIMRRARDANPPWTQDLAAAVAVATQAKLAKSTAKAVKRETPPPKKNPRETLKQPAPDETRHAVVARREQAQTIEEQAAAEVAATVDAVATENAGVVLGQRGRATRLATVGMAMLEELAGQAELAQHADRIIEVLAGEEPDPLDLAKVRDAVNRALGLGSRAATLRAIADALTKAQVLERQAYQLDAPQDHGAAKFSLPDPASIPADQCMAVYMAFVTGAKLAAPAQPVRIPTPEGMRIQP